MFPFIMFCDIIENIVLCHATNFFPSPPNHFLLTAGSIATKFADLYCMSETRMVSGALKKLNPSKPLPASEDYINGARAC